MARILFGFLLGTLVSGTSEAMAQNRSVDEAVARCSAGLDIRIDGELRGRIADAYEENDVVGDEFVFDRLGAIFRDATPRERIELYRIYVDCITSADQSDRNENIGYEEPSRDQLLDAHSAQIAPFALQMFPISHFEKAGCKPSNRIGYDCTYTIRAGSGGSIKTVTNTFFLSGDKWIMMVE